MAKNLAPRRKVIIKYIQMPDDATHIRGQKTLCFMENKKNLEYLAFLRRVMADKGIDTVIISGTDPHQSELPPAHWRGREWLTGFASGNGTNGTAVITADEALCWTDSR